MGIVYVRPVLDVSEAGCACVESSAVDAVATAVVNAIVSTMIVAGVFPPPESPA